MPHFQNGKDKQMKDRRSRKRRMKHLLARKHMKGSVGEEFAKERRAAVKFINDKMTEERMNQEISAN
jgi:hypothetical protein